MTQRASSTSEAAAAIAERNDSLACLLSSSQIRRRRARAVQILIAIASVMLCGELFMSQAHAALCEWSSWMAQLVFPSQNVTSVKVACLVGGLALTFYYLVVSDSHEQSSIRTTTSGIASPRSSSPRSSNKEQSSTSGARSTHRPTRVPPRTSEARTPALTTATAQQQIPRGPTPLPQISEPELPQIKLANEHQSSGISSNSSSSSSDPALHVNGKEPVAFENDLFQGHLLFLVRDSTLSSNRKANPTLKTNWSHLFNGRKRALWVQVQGRFKRVPPPDAALYLAAEVASPLVLGFWTRKLVEVLVSIMKKIARNVHISFGDDNSDKSEGGGDSSELVHAAFPLYQCVDEFVETPLTKSPPMLGIENFGESPQQKEQRMRSSSASSGNTKKEFALDKVYTFQFYTMYADLAQWQIANLPGMPEIPLKKLTGDQPIRFAAYTISPTTDQPPTGDAAVNLKHANAAKDYLFCFSLQYNEANKRPRGNSHRQPTNSVSSSAPTTTSTDQSSILCSPTASSLRSALVASPRRPPGSNEEKSEADAAAPASPTVPTRTASPPLPPKLVQHEQALRNLRFALPMWVEQVDRVAGNRKVSYLFTVEETTSTGSGGTNPPAQLTPHRYTVVRSAATIKNALLMLRDDNVDISTTSGSLHSDKSKGAASSTTSHHQPKFNRSHEEEFRKLLVESREFLYETITSETQALADALQKIADVADSDSTSSSSSPRRLDKLKRAMLYHCLKSSGALASVRAYQDIGIQLSKAKRERMDIICECGAYRVHSPRMLRQEWLMLTTSDVLFFRSYSMRACKTVAITELLRVQSVGAPHVLNPQGVDTDVLSAEQQPSSSWCCVELHLVCEIVKLFLDSEDARKQFVASLNQMLRLTAKPGRLPPPRSFESQSLPLCLNQRNMLSSSSSSKASALGFALSPTSSEASSPLALVQDILRKGIELYEMPLCDRNPSDLLPFLDAVELLSDMELPHGDDDGPVSPLVLHARPRGPSGSTAVLPFSHEEKLAFALNLYHVLYIHATLVFGAPGSQFQWKKLQSAPFYLIGKQKTRQVRLTLEAIEHEMLRAGATAATSSTTSLSATACILSPGTSARRLLQLGSGKTGAISATGGSTTTGAVGDLTVPKHLATTKSDFRTTFALQMNCNPSGEKHVIRVYDGTEKIHEQLNETSSLFLAQELRVDLVERVIWLPRVIEWRQQDFLPRSGKSVAMGLIGASGNGGTGDPRAFYCLQKLLGFLEETQRDQVQNVLLGVGKSARVVYDSFWTQSAGGSTSGAVALKRSTSSQSPDRALAKSNTRSSSKSVVEIGSGDAAAATPTPSGGGTSARQFFQSFF